MDPLCDVAKKLVPEMAFLFHVKLLNVCLVKDIGGLSISSNDHDVRTSNYLIKSICSNNGFLDTGHCVVLCPTYRAATHVWYLLTASCRLHAD